MGCMWDRMGWKRVVQRRCSSLVSPGRGTLGDRYYVVSEWARSAIGLSSSLARSRDAWGGGFGLGAAGVRLDRIGIR